MKTILLNCLVSSSACLLGAWALAVMWRNKSAAWRHFAWCLGFVAALAVMTLLLTSWRVEVPLLAVVEDSSAAVVQVETVSDSGDFAPVLLPPSVTAGRRVDWWLVIWLSGTAVCLSPLVVGWWRVRKFLQGGHGEHGGLQEQNLLHVLRDLPVKKSTLLLSDAAVVPLTVGMFAPRIVLPSSASAWTAERLRRVLAHEVAHQQRHDLAWALLARVVCALCWFNPLAWFAAHRQRLESERACDDCVINSGAAAADYASDLVQILRDCPRDVLSPLVMTMARHSQIKPRLQSLLAAGVQRGAVKRGIALALTLSVLLVAAALTVTRITHAADAVADRSASAPAAVKYVLIHAKFFSVTKNMVSTKLANYEQGWMGAEVEQLMKDFLQAGGDLMSEPVIVLRAGQTAKIRAGMPKFQHPLPGALDKYLPACDEAGNLLPTNFLKKRGSETVEVRPEILNGQIELRIKNKSAFLEGYGRIKDESAEGITGPVPVFSSLSIPPVSVRLPDGFGWLAWMPMDEKVDELTCVVLTVKLVDREPLLMPSVAERLEKIIIPQVEFADADIVEVLNYLKEQSKAHDSLGMGVNIVFKAEPTGSGAEWQPLRSLTLSLREVQLKKILDFITQLTSYQYKVEENCVYVFPNTEAAEPLLVRTFTVPENFFPAPVISAMLAGNNADVQKELSENGIVFPAGASAAYWPKTKKLVVRNTEEQLNKVEALLKNSEPPKTDAPKLSIEKKLEGIIVPECNLADADLREMVKFLTMKSREFDPEKVGVNFLIKSSTAAETAQMPKVTVNFKNYSLKQIMEQVPALFSLQYAVEEYAVFFVPGKELTRRVVDMPEKWRAAFADGDVQQKLTTMGLEFPDGASAIYRPSARALELTTTMEQMRKFEALLKEASAGR